jgi:hypothetical protein
LVPGIFLDILTTCKGNILPATSAAPALQAHAQELKRHMLADNLEHKIQNRPQPEELISQGILSEDENPRSPV